MYGTCMYKCAHIIKVNKWRGVIGAIMMIVGQGHIFLVMTCQYNNLVAGVVSFVGLLLRYTHGYTYKITDLYTLHRGND